MPMFGIHFDPQKYLQYSELKPEHKEGVGYGIDESNTWDELTEALAAKKYKLLRLERLDPVESDIFLVKVQNTKIIDRIPDTLRN
jgi:hypothetical protein